MGCVADNFWENVKVGSSDECWPWLRGHNPKTGYGSFRIKGRTVYAHRHAYTIANGSIPSGMHICHSCDNPICCNPNHLWVGTPADNAHDRDRKGRHSHKLRQSDIPAIRERAANGESHGSIAIDYGVTRPAISRVVRDVRRNYTAKYAKYSIERPVKLPTGTGGVVTIEGLFLHRCVVLNGEVIHRASTIERCCKWIQRNNYTLLEVPVRG